MSQWKTGMPKDPSFEPLVRNGDSCIGSVGDHLLQSPAAQTIEALWLFHSKTVVIKFLDLMGHLRTSLQKC